jgi:hypothetical protein
VAVSRFTDHFDIARGCEESPQSFPDNGMIVTN